VYGSKLQNVNIGAEISILRQIFESGYLENYKFTEFLPVYAQNLKVNFCLTVRLAERFGIVK